MPRPTARRDVRIKKPGDFDLKKGNEIAEKIVRENVDWLKEMAKK